MADGAQLPATPRQRLEELYRRLKALPRADSVEGAFEQLCKLLDEVEDELSGIPKQTPAPTLSMPDGRMYCPLEDFIEKRSNGSILAHTRGHRIEIASDGKIRIISLESQAVEFEDL